MKIQNNTAILCCGAKGCPELKVDNDRVIIKDDDGKVINISKKEADLIPEAIKKLSVWTDPVK